MTELAEIDALAADYVLGTLPPSERVALAARSHREPALAAAIVDWDARLAPLAEMVRPVTPPIGLLTKIERQIASRPKPASNVLPFPGAGADIADLQRRVQRWRSTAFIATAAAASLVIAFGWREVDRAAPDQTFVAVFQQGDASPEFVLSVDTKKRTLSVRRVAAQVPAGKTYQLWIASDQLGVGPQSLGLIEDQNVDVQKAISRIDPAIVQKALFGVSLEPAGGSPTGKPTGPVFHARLIPTAL